MTFLLTKTPRVKTSETQAWWFQGSRVWWKHGEFPWPKIEVCIMDLLIVICIFYIGPACSRYFHLKQSVLKKIIWRYFFAKFEFIKCSIQNDRRNRLVFSHQKTVAISLQVKKSKTPQENSTSPMISEVWWLLPMVISRGFDGSIANISNAPKLSWKRWKASTLYRGNAWVVKHLYRHAFMF